MTDDDNFDNFDEFDGASGIDQEQAVARFQQEVSKKMKLLLTKKAGVEKRVEAALWLGEAGDPKAITALRTVYKGDKDQKVKSAVEYALGMFKALDLAIERAPGETVTNALEREENQVIVELLTNIAVKGEFGKRRSSSFLTRIMMLLIVILIVLVGLNVMLLLPANEGGGNLLAELGQSNTGDPALDTLADLQIMTDAMRVDGSQIQTQLTGLDVSTGGTPVNCAFTFNRPTLYVVSDESVIDGSTQNGFFIRGVYTRVNDAVGTLGETQSTFDELCDTLTPDDNPGQTEVNQTLTSLEELMVELDSIEQNISQLEETIRPVPTESVATEPAIDATEEATEDLGPTSTPTITPTATPDPLTYRTYVREITDIINQVTEPRRALEQLDQAWADVAASGTTGACDTVAPIVPENYTGLPDEVAQQVPELAEAVEQLNNIGLTLLRNGWSFFTQACLQGTLAQNLATGQTTVETARSGFTNARNILNQLPR